MKSNNTGQAPARRQVARQPGGSDPRASGTFRVNARRSGTLSTEESPMAGRESCTLDPLSEDDDDKEGLIAHMDGKQTTDSVLSRRKWKDESNSKTDSPGQVGSESLSRISRSSRSKMFNHEIDSMQHVMKVFREHRKARQQWSTAHKVSAAVSYHSLPVMCRYHVIRSVRSRYEAQLDTFWRVLDEAGSVKVDVPEQYKRVSSTCKCGHSCQLRRYPDPSGVFWYFMWICPKRTCMHWELHENDADLAEELVGQVSEEVLARRSQEVGVILGTHLALLENTKGDPQMSVEQLWQEGEDGITKLDNQVHDYIGAQIPEQLCDCNLPCEKVLCNVTGGLFHVCPTRTCFCVVNIVDTVRTADMELGQVIPFTESFLDRYCTATTFMRWFGYTFTDKFALKLANQKPESSYPDGSLEFPRTESGMAGVRDGKTSLRKDAAGEHGLTGSAPAKGMQGREEDMQANKQEFDIYLSYREAAGFHHLWPTLCAHMNILPTFSFVFLFCPLVLLVLVCIKDPCANVGAFFVACQDGNKSWYLFQPWATLVVMFFVLLWTPVTSVLTDRRKYFVDRFCMHQADPRRTSAGIMRHSLFLRNSRELLCLTDEDYFKRIWCMWELAVYLKLRTDPSVYFVSMPKRTLDFIVIMVYAFLLFLWTWIYFDKRNEGVQSINDTRYVIGVSMSFVGNVIVRSAGFLYGQQHFRDQFRLKETLQNYDVRNAKCSQPGDRLVLLRLINEIFREDHRPSGSVTAGTDPRFSFVGSPMAGEAVDSVIGGDTPQPRESVVMPSVPETDIVHSGVPVSSADTSANLRIPTAKEGVIDLSMDSLTFSTDPDSPPARRTNDAVGAYPPPPAPPGTTRFENGLDRFNQFVKTAVPAHLPASHSFWHGIPSLAILSYMVVVMAPNAVISDQSFYYFDRWAYRDIAQTDPYATVGFGKDGWHGFMFVFAWAWDTFVALPFAFFTFGAYIRLYLLGQDLFCKHTGLHYWWSVLIFMPIFLMDECVFAWRTGILLLIRTVTVRGCIVGGTVYPFYNPYWTDMGGTINYFCIFCSNNYLSYFD